mmetsp:Transcript_7916/g.33321  ORF Transcript_7916/g.33321 Transcript_7916/m.33321 type:complete len:688 (-) Transcript_7916:36-2099(-)
MRKSVLALALLAMVALAAADGPFNGALLRELSPDCAKELGGGMAEEGASDTTAMILASGKLPGDLGNWWGCTHEIEGAHYAVATTDSDDDGAPCQGSLQIAVCNVGFCLPLSCGEQDVQALATSIFFPNSAQHEVVVNWQADNSLSENPLAVVGVVVVSALAAVVLAGTAVWMVGSGSVRLLYGRQLPAELQEARAAAAPEAAQAADLPDLAQPDLDLDLEEDDGLPPAEPVSLLQRVQRALPDDSFGMQACKSVALDNNVARLGNKIPGDFGALNGLRFFSMLWVIWGHTLFFWAFVGTTNMEYAYNHAMQAYWVQIIFSAVFGVDSFFFLSGFLVTYFVYETLQEGKKIQWFLYYFHRVWRILPLYSFLMFVYATISPVLGSGPAWFAYKEEVARTLPYFWSNLLFINNFYPEPQLQFMGWSWFLAVDLQFYVVSPFVILLHHRSPRLGWLLWAVLLVADLTTATTMSTVYGLSPDLMKPQPDFFNVFYQKPYCRASPYLVGMAAAYAYSYISRKRPNLQLPWWLLTLGYGLALSAMYAIIWGTYGDDDWAQWQNTLYLGFSRFGWGLAVGYIMLMSFLGYGGLIRTLLCWRYWEPFAKLTYGAYLCHPIVVQLFYYSQWQYLAYQNWNMMYYFIAHAFCAYSFAAVAYLLVEKPCMNLEPLVIKKIITTVARLRGKPLPDLGGH